MQNYYKPGSGLANAGKVEALLLDGNGDYDPGNPLVYASPLNSDVNPAIANLSLAQDLKHVATMIRADVGARFFHVAIGGFDTHSNQEDGSYHSELLRQVSESIAAFTNELAQSVTLPGGYSGYQTGNLSNEVLLLVMTFDFRDVFGTILARWLTSRWRRSGRGRRRSCRRPTRARRTRWHRTTRRSPRSRSSCSAPPRWTRRGAPGPT